AMHTLGAEYAVSFSILFSVLTLIGVVGNLLVIVAIGSDRKMRACIMNILLLNLAVADLSNVVLAMGEWSPAVFIGRPLWILPDALCPINRYLECVFLFTSISTQLIVCLERYIATIHPMRARAWCCRNTALKAVAIAWGLAAVFALPYALHHQVIYRGSDRHCVNVALNQSWWLAFKFVEFIQYFVCPCAIIFIGYSKIASVLWAKNPVGIKSDSAHMVQSGSEKQLATRRTVVKMLVTCALVYFCCYAPIQALFLTKSIFKLRYHPNYEVILLLNVFAVTCSASNPLLYTLFSTRFRNRLKTLLFSSERSDRYSSVANGREPVRAVVTRRNSCCENSSCVITRPCLSTGAKYPPVPKCLYCL
ncbi:hypothetical protein PMAYCL1PPCAC_14085, partial [Pristionchus mayeri]